MLHRALRYHNPPQHHRRRKSSPVSSPLWPLPRLDARLPGADHTTRPHDGRAFLLGFRGGAGVLGRSDLTVSLPLPGFRRASGKSSFPCLSFNPLVRVLHSVRDPVSEEDESFFENLLLLGE